MDGIKIKGLSSFCFGAIFVWKSVISIMERQEGETFYECNGSRKFVSFHL